MRRVRWVRGYIYKEEREIVCVILVTEYLPWVNTHLLSREVLVVINGKCQTWLKLTELGFGHVSISTMEQIVPGHVRNISSLIKI